jgi:hypothetical protein
MKVKKFWYSITSSYDMNLEAGKEKMKFVQSVKKKISISSIFKVNKFVTYSIH